MKLKPGARYDASKDPMRRPNRGKKMGPQPKPTSGRDPHAAMDRAKDANQAAFNKYTMKDQGMKKAQSPAKMTDPKLRNMGKNFKGAYGGK